MHIHPQTYIYIYIHIHIYICVYTSTWRERERDAFTYIIYLTPCTLGSLANVSAPAVLEHLSTKRVMVMDWVEGTRLTDASDLGGTGFSRATLVDTLVQCSLRQVIDR